MGRVFLVVLALLVSGLFWSSIETMAQIQPSQGASPRGVGGSETLGAQERDIQGTIRSVDPDGGVVVLEDGTRLTIPASLRPHRDALKEGATVKVSYEERGGEKVVTSIEVRPENW